MRLSLTLLALSLLTLSPTLAGALAASSSSGYYDPEIGTTRDASGLRHLAEGHYLDGDLGTAAQLYREAARLANDPGEKGESLVLAAWLEFLDDRPQDSHRSLAQALAIDPYLEFNAANFNKGFEQLYLRARVQSARDGALKPPPAVHVSIERPVVDPAANAYRLGLEQLEKGDADAALKALQHASALTYSGDDVDLNLRRKALLRTGLLYYERGQWGDAANTFEEAVGLDRNDADAWENLGLARERVGENAGAIEAFTEAYVLDPTTRERAHLLAQALVRSERWEDAASWVLDAIRHHERDAYLQLQLGVAQAGRGAFERAEVAWRKASELDTSLDWGFGRLASARLTSHHLDQGQFTEAVRVARLALEHDSADAHFWNLLGLAQQESGDLGSARQSFLTACNQDESRAEYRNNLGRAYAAAGDLALAEQAFVQALTLRPDLPTAQANLAQVRELQQRP